MINYSYSASAQEIAEGEAWLVNEDEHDSRCGVGSLCKECTEGTAHTCHTEPSKSCSQCCLELTIDAYWGVDSEGNCENDLAVD